MKDHGIVFNIQRFSLHDGPGIRTIVFLKGCPFTCPWCSNPESQQAEPSILFNASKCIRCESCVAVCAPKAIRPNYYEADRIDRSKCTLCGKCVEVCPTEALFLKGKLMSAAEVIAEVEKDRRVYQTSGGGATFSGGEPFVQHEFLINLLASLKEIGISTAIETTGAVSWEILRQSIPYTDYYLYDIKHTDSQKHKAVAGIGNELILDNVIKLSRETKGLVLRMPVIPGFNDDLENVRATARIVKEANLKSISLLPYHNFGESKYGFMNLTYKMANYSNQEIDNTVQAVAEEFRKQGIETLLGG
ncbi:MAG: glycyl-radical enzyme activating protein [Christensenellales bacterium]